MGKRQLRFVHAGDLHLEQPLSGISDVPRHLRGLFLDAGMKAAEHVFDTVVEEQADFLLLSGDVVQLRTGGARAVDFLWRQFNRLRELSIPVYWCDGGRDETEHWPTAVPLPSNVHTFGSHHVERLTLRREHGRDVVIYGCGSSQNVDAPWNDFHHTGEAYSIALIHHDGPIPTAELNSSIHYWALGGDHQRHELSCRGTTAYVCGSPQGLRLSEDGPHGCAVIDVDQRGMTHRHFVMTDVVRWFDERIELPDHMDANSLMRLLRDRTAAVRDAAAGRQALVRWRVIDGDQISDTQSDLLAARLRQGGLAGELLQAIRNEFGMELPGVWSVAIEAEPPVVLPSGWYEEDTVLGDLLRLVQQIQNDPKQTVALEPISGKHALRDDLVQRLNHVEPAQRESLLRRVAILGVDVLRGDRVLSDEFARSTGE